MRTTDHAMFVYFHFALPLIFSPMIHIMPMIAMPPRPLLLTIIGNESRLRILLALAKHLDESLTVYKISKFSGLERKVIKAHLRKLLDAELIQAKSYGPIFLYSLNRESTPVQRLMELFKDSRLLGEALMPVLCYGSRSQKRARLIGSSTMPAAFPETSPFA